MDGGIIAIHGAVLMLTGNWDPFAWFEKGNVHRDIDSARDIVSEWVEPKAPRPRMLAFISRGSGALSMLPENHSISLDLNDLIRMPHLDEPDNTDKGEVHAN